MRSSSSSSSAEPPPPTSTGPQSGPPASRKRRWGDVPPPPPPPPAANDNKVEEQLQRQRRNGGGDGSHQRRRDEKYGPRTSSATTTTDSTTVLVSQDDALRALLQSVEAQKQQQQKQQRQNRDRPGPHPSGRSARSARQSGDGGGSNDNNDDAGYYGPSREGGGSRHGSASSSAAGRISMRDDEARARPSRSVNDRGTGGDHGNEPPADDGNNNCTTTTTQPQQQPDFGLSGALTKDSRGGNVYKGVVLKFREPPEARAPTLQWRLYVHKGDELVETLHVSRQSAYLFGRASDIADIVLLHPSCSAQHAVLQYRAVPSPEHQNRLHTQPYLMDLESTNGTVLNGVTLDPARYYQLKKGDVLRFGASTREYVLLHE